MKIVNEMGKKKIESRRKGKKKFWEGHQAHSIRIKTHKLNL